MGINLAMEQGPLKRLTVFSDAKPCMSRCFPELCKKTWLSAGGSYVVGCKALLYRLPQLGQCWIGGLYWRNVVLHESLDPGCIRWWVGGRRYLRYIDRTLGDFASKDINDFCESTADHCKVIGVFWTRSQVL